MISVSGKKWEQNKVDRNLVEKLKQDFNFSDVVSTLAISREFDYTELNLINNNSNLNNVFFKNIDFKKSIELVVSSINNNERICVLEIGRASCRERV